MRGESAARQIKHQPWTRIRYHNHNNKSQGILLLLFHRTVSLRFTSSQIASNVKVEFNRRRRAEARVFSRRISTMPSK